MAILPVEDRLDELQVPVAELVPSVLVEAARVVVEAVRFEGLRAFSDHPLQGAENPSIRQLHGPGQRFVKGGAVKVHKGETARIPEFVDEVSVPLDPLLGEANVSSLGGEGSQGKAEGIGAVAVHDDERIDDVPPRLTHLLPFCIPDEGMNVHFPERHRPHDVEAHHHHTGNPKKENVEGGDEGGSGVKTLELRRLLGPSHGGEGPQGGTEPGVQDVLVLN
jgi:hypothetical protein